ncbi:MAG: NADH-quinone oxidoreductase subunit NuoB [Coriobacteriaceae bacterium]|nr:NADH-quinone oxidoreductase subunit NuoB [Coriobacteriaceae bacterium]
MGYSSKSPWLIHYDGSSCNGCDIEVLDSMMPLYDIERFGIINTGNPKHADIFLVTGSVNAQNIEVVRHIYDQMLEPKVVVACGICACTGGVFRDCYNVIGGVDKAIPVDVYAPGCAVRPETIIDAVLKAVEILDEKAERMAKGVDPATAPREGLLPGKGYKTNAAGELEQGDTCPNGVAPAATPACESPEKKEA